MARLSPIRPLSPEEQQLFDKTVVMAIAVVPAFRDGFALLRPFFDATASTAYTDQYSRIGLSPWFFSLPERQRVTALLHEVMHVLNDHFTRSASLRNSDPEVATLAGDFEINSGLSMYEKLDVSFGVLPDDPNFGYGKHQSMEQYFSKLKEDGYGSSYRGDEAGDEFNQEGDENASDTENKDSDSSEDGGAEGSSSKNENKNEQSEDKESGEKGKASDSENRTDESLREDGETEGAESSKGNSEDSENKDSNHSSNSKENDGSNQKEHQSDGDSASENAENKDGEEKEPSSSAGGGGGEEKDEACSDEEDGEGSNSPEEGEGSEEGSDTSNDNEDKGAKESNLPKSSVGKVSKTYNPPPVSKKKCDEATEKRSRLADEAGIEKASPSEITNTKANTIIRIQDELKKSERWGSSSKDTFLQLAEVNMRPSKVSWKSIFKKAVARMNDSIVRGKTDYSYKRVNRRAQDRDYILPGMYSYEPSCMFAIDTSGSMGQEDYELLLSEVEEIVKKTLRGKNNFSAFSVDTSVKKTSLVKKVKDINLQGGGGTDMSMALRFINGLSRKEWPDIFILATDGGTDWKSYQREFLRLQKPLYNVVLVTEENGYKSVPEELKKLVTFIDVSPDSRR